jgi:hypothetical protein
MISLEKNKPPAGFMIRFDPMDLSLLGVLAASGETERLDGLIL